MKTQLLYLTTFALLSAVSPLYAADGKRETTMNNCVNQQIRDTSIVVRSRFSDPGGLKQRAAKEQCEYEKAMNRRNFENKYGSDKKRKS